MINYYKALILIMTSMSVVSCGGKSEEEQYLADIRLNSKLLTECESTKVLDTDCDKLLDERKRLILEFQMKHDQQYLKEVIRDKHEAASELGELDARGVEEPNINTLVKRALNASSLAVRVELIKHFEDYNYLIFDPRRCSQLAPQTYYQRITDRKVWNGSDYITVTIFYRIEGERQCFDIDDLEEDFVIISEKQLKTLEAKESFFSYFVESYASFEEAKKASKEISEAWMTRYNRTQQE